jgi:hypothetical protein
VVAGSTVVVGASVVVGGLVVVVVASVLVGAGAVAMVGSGGALSPLLEQAASTDMAPTAITLPHRAIVES